MFNKIAQHYDMIMQPFDYNDLVDYLDDLIIGAGGERTNVLDLGCGTSEELIYFRQLGYEVAGLDMSEEMIKISEYKHPGVDFFQENMINFKLKKKYDNIISCFDTINYIIDKKKLSKCFASTNKAMNKGGVFLFDFNTVFGLIDEWEGVRIEETDDFFISYDSNFNYDNLVLECKMKFFIREEEGKYASFDETHYERGYTSVEIKELLKLNGFKLVKLLPFLKRKATKDTKLDRYQAVAVKIKEI
ncbi:MAG: methyltransferase domain-containing protein [Candidatus Delongbacteria bacterium]|jgi:SAM-dependent methyltransferase|nr:methyltransferase domain-containing protein [Candidatus Delongbacteria bacterium]